MNGRFTIAVCHKVGIHRETTGSGEITVKNTGSIVIGSLFVFTLSLIMLGLIMVLSSSQGLITSDSPDSNVYEYMGKQLMWFSIGLAAMFFFFSYDYNNWERKARWLMLISAVLLIALFTPLSREINYARRWLIIFGFRFQPSDFAKVAIIMYVAAVWAEKRDQLDSFFKAVFFPMLFVGALLLLIVKEPDHGTTFMIGMVVMIMWFAAGARLSHQLPVLTFFALGLYWGIKHYPSLSNRINAWLYPEQYLDREYYQVYQSLIGFAHGGWSGAGLGNGVQQLGFTPYPYTDFIFSTMGEELGFIRCSIVLALYLGLILSGFVIAYRCSNPFGRLLAVGCTSAIGLQAILNIAVVTGAIPTTGIALPFISYGGSSLTVSMAMIGLLMNIAKDSFIADNVPVRRKRIASRHGFVQ
ncbi:MAG: cell division protein FtsW [Candidatus Omnitrophota bacterium]|nr:MAG: cell division protein FtsW [Candidatus Omnitrophota bacterium]